MQSNIPKISFTHFDPSGSSRPACSLQIIQGHNVCFCHCLCREQSPNRTSHVLLEDLIPCHRISETDNDRVEPTILLFCAAKLAAADTWLPHRPDQYDEHQWSSVIFMVMMDWLGIFTTHGGDKPYPVVQFCGDTLLSTRLFVNTF